jgi:hypothetical protein
MGSRQLSIKNRITARRHSAPDLRAIVRQPNVRGEQKAGWATGRGTF